MVLALFCVGVYAQKAPVKTLTPAQPVSYEQQIKNAQDLYNQQSTWIQKAKVANETIITKASTDNQKLTLKADSIATAFKTKLQEINDVETKKIQDAQNSLDSRKAEINKIYKEATGSK